jgi:hypothetical protein
MEIASGRGRGEDMQPHKRIAVRRDAEAMVERFFGCVETALTELTASGAIVINGPELDKKRVPG